MNKTLKAQLIAITLSLPAIEYKDKKLYKEILGRDLIDQAKKEAEESGNEYIHPTWPRINDKNIQEDVPVKPSQVYRFHMGNLKVDHYEHLIKAYRKAGWDGVQDYQNAVREAYAEISE